MLPSNSKLISSKIKQFLPFMLLSQASVILIVFADGLVAGNFVGPDGLAAINVAYPLTIIMSLFTVPVQSGMMTRLVYHLGRDNARETAVCISASRRLIVTAAIILSIVQLPFPRIIAASANLTPDIYGMSIKYMTLLMLTAPIGIISACGVNVLSAYGKMSAITFLTVFEGSINLLLDLLFTGVLGMGVVGVGLGTVIATFARCAATLVIIKSRTPFFSISQKDFENGNEGSVSEDIKKETGEMLHLGIPNTICQLENLVKSWLLVWGLSMAMGSDSLGCLSIRSFIISFSFIFIEGFSGVMRIIVGLEYGIGDFNACIRMLRRTGFWITIIIVLISSTVLIYPEIFFKMFGYDTIDPYDLKAIRIFTLSLPFLAAENVMADFLTMVQKPKEASWITLVDGFIAFIPTFLILLFISGNESIWYSFLIASTASMILALLLTFRVSRQEIEKNKDKIMVSYSITPDQSGTLNAQIERFGIESGLPEDKAYRLALSVDEITGYNFKSRRDKTYMDVFLSVDKGDVQLVLIDNGNHSDTTILYSDVYLKKLIEANADNVEEIDKYLSTDFALVKDTVKSINYQWLWNMNHTTISI